MCQAACLRCSALLVAVHVLRMGLSRTADTWLTLALAFIPGALFRLSPRRCRAARSPRSTSFLTHTLVHGDCGAPRPQLRLARRLRRRGRKSRRTRCAFCCFSAFCAIAGAATFLVFNPGLMVPMVGASGAISGLMGATMRFLFTAVDGAGSCCTAGESALGAADAARAQALHRQARRARHRRVSDGQHIGRLGLGSVGESGIAWEAHIGGYFAGLLSFGFFDAAQTDSSPEHYATEFLHHRPRLQHHELPGASQGMPAKRQMTLRRLPERGCSGNGVSARP